MRNPKRRKYKGYVFERKEKCSATCVNRQPSLFENPDVIAHVKKSKTVSLCANTSPKSRRKKMLLSQEDVKPRSNWHYYNQAQAHEKARFKTCFSISARTLTTCRVSPVRAGRACRCQTWFSPSCIRFMSVFRAGGSCPT